MTSAARRTRARLSRFLADPRAALGRKLVHLRRRMPGVEHAGWRSTGRTRTFGSSEVFEKTFLPGERGTAARDQELLARELFADRPWMVPILDVRGRAIVMPRLPEASRLDVLGPTLDARERLHLAEQAAGIAFDIFAAGYAHRDFHTKNLFRVDGELVLIDYEWLCPYPDDQRPAFADSYDIVGRGLDSPHLTGAMGYASPAPSSLAEVLGVPFEQALPAVVQALKDEARAASLSFKKTSTRHRCVAGKIYNTVDLPGFRITADEAQRDCAARMRQFGVDDAVLRGRTVLDLGSNIGGMLFEAQRFGPSRSLGVEYDEDKVRCARRIARFAGAPVEFLQADIDALTAGSLGSFDVVFCLAIEQHVQQRSRLFELLGQVCGGQLFFESNSGATFDELAARLTEVGFAEITDLGLSTDDARRENWNRVVLTARR